MDSLDAQVTIGTAPNTVVLDTAPFDLVGVGAGGRTWRRRTVEGPYMHGRRLLSAVLNTQVLTVVVRVVGSSWAEVCSSTETLFNALSQHTYPVTVTVEGETETYQCEPADITNVAGDTLSKFHAMSNMQEYQVQIPIGPVSTS